MYIEPMPALDTSALFAPSKADQTAQLTVLPALREAQLRFGRMHEACGPARHTFAMWVAGQVAAQSAGRILWISPGWVPHRLNPCGMMPLVNPARFIFVTADRPQDILWCVEETLRAGIIPLTVADLPAMPGLTQVRRMHLAAENGSAKAATPPLGLLLTPGTGGAAGVETRWHLAQNHGSDRCGPRYAPRYGWTLERLRARTAPRKSWALVSGRADTLPEPDQSAPPLA